MECKFPIAGNMYESLAECLFPDDVPQRLRAIITTGNGDCLYNAVSLAITGEKSIVAFLFI